MFITQDKTNWKFILIVVVLAVIVGGGTWWCLQKEFLYSQIVELKIPEKDNRILLTEEKIKEIWQKEYDQGTLESLYIKFNLNSPSTEILYSNKEKGISLKIPYNPSWGNENYKIPPYYESEDSLSFGPLTVIPPALNWVRLYKINLTTYRPREETFNSLKKETESDNPSVDPYYGVQKEEVNGIPIIKYVIVDGNVPVIEVFGSKYNYLFSGGATETIEGTFKFFESIIKTMQFIDETADLSSKALATEDWQIYRNEEYGFEIRYPEYFENTFLQKGTETEGLDESIFNPHYEENPFGESGGFQIAKMKNVFEDWIEYTKRQYAYVHPTEPEKYHRYDFKITEFLLLKSVQFYATNGYSEDSEISGFAFVGPEILKIIYLEKDGYIWRFMLPDTPIYNQMLSTFKFIDNSKELTIGELKNSEYYVVYGEKIQLKDGHFSKFFSEFDVSLEVEIYSDKIIAFGDLNNDGAEDAAVVLTSKEGGTGSFRKIAIMLNQNGSPVYLTSEDLGDRVVINSVNIQSGIITLGMIVHGLNDGLCCPTLNKTFKYKLSENQLVEITD